MVYHAADRTFMKERWTSIRRKDLQQSKNKTEKETIKKRGHQHHKSSRDIFSDIGNVTRENVFI